MRAVVTVGLVCAIGLFFSCGREGGEDDGTSGHPDPGAASDAPTTTDAGIDGCIRGAVVCPRGAGTGSGQCPDLDGCNQCNCSSTGEPRIQGCSTHACPTDSDALDICPTVTPDAAVGCTREGLRCWYLADAGCVHAQCNDGGWEVGPIDSCF